MNVIPFEEYNFDLVMALEEEDEVITMLHQEDMNMCTNFHYNPSINC